MSKSLPTVPRIVVVGSINMDLVYQVDRHPRPGETITGRELRQVPGGKGANQAVAAARLGAQTTLIGRVGDDDLGTSLRAALATSGVDGQALQITRDCASGVAVIAVDRTGQNSICVIAGANGQLSLADVQRYEQLISSADALLVQLEVPQETTAAALRLARAHRVLTVLDPAPVPASPLPHELFEVEVVSPNQTEAEQITGVAVHDAAAAPAAARALQALGARRVVLKLGEHGAYVLDETGRGTQVPSWPVQVVDTTSAGDAFTAALAVAIVEGKSLVDAARFATAAGALATTRAGAQPALPVRAAVDALVGGR